ncbi:MAG TPA: GNAT family N-acetyltransferase [Candidatus Babeliales bacterium]|nr:GNAT family N-acetyltransferase [Candidatus Babeliales bacterium]
MDHHIGFRPLQESDFPLLVQWLNTPHVKQWWDPDHVWNLDTVTAKYRSYVNGYKLIDGKQKPIHAFIIVLDDKPIGYIQYYNAYDFPRTQGYLQNLPASLAAFNIYIGEPSVLGKGLGAIIIKQFLTLYIWPHFDVCFVDPETANIGAIKTFEKVGFNKIKIVGIETWMICYNNKEKTNDDQ